MISVDSNDATRLSFERLIAVRPRLAGCARLGVLREIPPQTLLHAGPPFADRQSIPVPVLNAAIASALFEGWAANADAAAMALQNGDIALAPAQDHDVVTPLAFVVSPSMYVLVVEDEGGMAGAKLSPVNDGPPPSALRFGAATEGRAERLAALERIGPLLSAALVEPISVLPVMAAGLAAGDDLHGRVSGANAALAALLQPRLDGEARAYVEGANQFVLNVVMAACALMISAGAGIKGSRMVTAAGANGVDMGWQLAGEPSLWQTAPADVPVGPRFPGAEAARPLPAIGDSAVIDACGFGAAALRHAPDLMTALATHCPDGFFDTRASRAFIGAHPALPADLALGLDFGRTGDPLGIMLAILDGEGQRGLIGRGIAPWPH